MGGSTPTGVDADGGIRYRGYFGGARHMTRRRFTPDQKHRIIYRYKKGDLVKIIAYDFGTSTDTICSIVHRAGERRRIGERKLVEHPVPAKIRAWKHRRREEAKRYVRAWLDQPRHE